MLNINPVITWLIALSSTIAFPLSFTVEKNNPLCFLERFDFGEVI